jgi:TP901 family phage tail tape measure protein
MGQLNFSQQAQALQAFGSQVADTGRGMMSFAGNALGGILSAGGDFEAAMNSVAAVSNLDLNSDAFTQLSARARELGSTTQFSATEAAGAMQMLAMAGFETNDVLGSTSGVLALAAAGNLDLASAADIASNVLSGYAPALDQSLSKSEQLAGVNDILANTFTNSNTSLTELGDGFSYAAPIASSLGVSFESAAASLGVLSDSGIKGSRAGTNLAGALTKLSAPTGRAKEALEAINFSLQDFQDESGNLDLSGMLGALREAREAGDLDNNAMRDIFGLENQAGAGILIENLERINELTASNSNAGGVASQVADTQMQGLQGAIKLFESAREGLMIALADSGILGVFTNLVQGVAGFVQALSNLPSPILGVVTGVVALVGAIGAVLVIGGSILALIGGIGAGIAALPLTIAVIAPLLAGLGGAIASGLALALPVIAGIAVAGLVLYKAWNQISAFFAGFVEGFKDGLSGLSEPIQSIRESFASVGQALAPVFEMIFGRFEGGEGSVKMFGAVVGEVFGRIVTLFAQIASLVASAIAGFAAFGQAVGEGLYTLLSGTEEGVGGLVNFASNLRQSFDFAVGEISSRILGIRDSIMQSDIVQALGVVLSGVKNYLTNLWSQAQEKGALIRNTLIQVFTNVSSVFLSLRQSVTEFFAQVLTSISGFFFGIFERFLMLNLLITEFFAQVLTSISGFFLGIFERFLMLNLLITEFFAQVLTSISNFVLTVMSRLVELGGFVTGLLSSLWASIQAVFTSVTAFIATISESLRPLIDSALQPFRDMWSWVTDKLDSLSVFVRDNIESFTGAITGLMNTLSGFARSVQSQLSRFNPFAGGGGGSSSGGGGGSSSPAESSTTTSSAGSDLMAGGAGGDDLDSANTDTGSAANSVAGLAGSVSQGLQPVSVPTNQAGFGTTNAAANDGSAINNESSTRNAAFTVSNLTINAGETSDPSRLADMLIGELDRRYNDELDGRVMA